MSQEHSLRIFAGALLIGLLALLLAACGGGGGGGDNATATKAATKVATKPATKAATAQATTGPATAPSAASTATRETQRPATAPAPATEPPAATNTPRPAPQTRLDVVMIEFDITPSIATVPAGRVTFDIKNRGQIAHDFYVIKTDLAPDALPYDSAAYQARLSGLNVVKYQPPITAGTSAQVTVDLSSGRYVLICNIVGHYQAGSSTAFTVQ